MPVFDSVNKTVKTNDISSYVVREWTELIEKLTLLKQFRSDWQMYMNNLSDSLIIQAQLRSF